MLLLNVNGQQLWSWRDSQLTLPHFSWAGLDHQYSAHSFARNWQLPFLNQWKGENDRRKEFMINLKKRMVPDQGRLITEPSDKQKNNQDKMLPVLLQTLVFKSMNVLSFLACSFVGGSTINTACSGHLTVHLPSCTFLILAILRLFAECRTVFCKQSEDTQRADSQEMHETFEDV